MRFVTSNYWTNCETNILNHRKLYDISFKKYIAEKKKVSSRKFILCSRAVTFTL